MRSVRETFCDTLDRVNKVEITPQLVVVLRHTNLAVYKERLIQAGAIAELYRASIIQPFGNSTLEEAEELTRNFSLGQPMALVTHRYHIYRAYLTFAALYGHVSIIPIAVDQAGFRDDPVEIEKIRKYQRKGDILSYTAGLKQLQWHFSQ